MISEMEEQTRIAVRIQLQLIENDLYQKKFKKALRAIRQLRLDIEQYKIPQP